jgi:hypothetical protein
LQRRGEPGRNSLPPTFSVEIIAMSREKLIAYEFTNNSNATLIRPARRERKWMDDTPQKYAYRCLPMVIANQFGWDLLSTHKVRASWDGGTALESLKVEVLYGDGAPLCSSHFGSGVLTFSLPFLFKTPPGWNLMVRGPTNAPKDGIVGLDGIVETDWTHNTFTMNWKFTRACTVEFDVGEAVCTVFPVQRGLLDRFEPVIEPIETNPEFHQKYLDWSQGRDRFIVGLRDREDQYVKEGWEKDYMRASHETKLAVDNFGRKKPDEKKE